MNTIFSKTNSLALATIIAALCIGCACIGCASGNGDDDTDDGGGTDDPSDWHPAYPVDDFEDQNDAILEGTGDWITYADVENGAEISPTENDITAGIEAGGPAGSEYAMHITGNIGDGSSWGTGIEAFFEMDGSDFVVRDFAANDNEGLVVWAKGNCKLRACVNMKELVPAPEGTCDEETSTECWMFHCTETDNVLTDEWTMFEMPFGDFEQSGGSTSLDLSTIVSVQFTQDSETCPDADFDLWIDNVGIYGGSEWEDVWALFDE